MRIGWRTGLLRSLFCVMMTMAGVAGCVAPSDDERRMLGSGERALVLVRFAARGEGTSFFPADRRPMIYISSLSGDGSPIFYSDSFAGPWPDDEKNRQGWTYAMLPPGDYFLATFNLGEKEPAFRFSVL